MDHKIKITMRRKEKAISDKSIIEKILVESEICRIAMVDGTEPYMVPLNYGYMENIIYMHSAPEGRKIELLKANNRICFEIEYASEIIRKDEPCKWSTKYRSLIGYGNIEIITDTRDKKKGLDIIMQKYGYQGQTGYNDGSLDRMVLLKINIEQVTAKQSGDW
jgi:nitroimidazol reductase NimA-like FMN-containing flavoprotein (pyridoxamine 5'-phosphate oxidase superfamily)